VHASAATRWQTLALALGFLALSLAAKLGPWYALGFLGERSLLRSILAGAIAFGLALTLTILALRRLPGRAHPQLELLPTGRGSQLLVVSLGVGAALFGLVFAAAVMVGGLQLEWISARPAHLAGVFLTTLIGTVLNAAWEEYTFRGWAFSACVRSFGPHGVALALGSAFGLAHLLNPSWTPAAIASTAVAGFLISYAMLAYQDLGVPLGLHVGWNYTQTLLTSRRFWRVSAHPSAWRSGGAFGLEASVPGVAVTSLAALGALALFLARERRRAATEG